MGFQEVTLTLGLAPARTLAKRDISVTLTQRQSLVMRQVFEWLKDQGATYRRWDGRAVPVAVVGDVVRVFCDLLEEEAGA